MNKKIPTLRTPLAKVRGLGSAKQGAHHWSMMHATSLALVFLSLYVFATFFVYVIGGGYDGAVYWLRSPFSATFVVLFLAVGFQHSAGGLQVVIEDYVHCNCAKSIAIYAVKFLSAAFALLGILATVKVLFGV